MPSLPFSSDFIIPLPPTILVAVLLFFFVIWLGYTLILRYHWSRYASRKMHVLQMTLVYTAGSVALWAGTIAFFLMYYMNSY